MHGRVRAQRSGRRIEKTLDLGCRLPSGSGVIDENRAYGIVSRIADWDSQGIASRHSLQIQYAHGRAAPNPPFQFTRLACRIRPIEDNAHRIADAARSAMGIGESDIERG